MTKIPFSVRLTPEVLCRLQELTKAQKSSHNDTISLALAALERERKTGMSLPERVDFLEKNISAFFNLVMTFTEKLEEKFDQANLYEKERLKSLYQLLNEKMAESEKAQDARFVRFLSRIKEDEP